MNSTLDNNDARFERSIEAPEFPHISEGFLPENVILGFYFTPHLNAEHFDEGAELLNDADVFIPELVCWDQQALRQYNAVSKADRRVLGKLIEANQSTKFGSYSDAVVSALYNTRKPVGFIDADHTRKDLLIGDFKSTYARVITSEVESTLDGIADQAARIAGLSLTRDVIMIESLEPVMDELVVSHPRLSTQARVEVLIALGVNHQQVYEYFKADPDTSEQVKSYLWADKTEFHSEGKLVDKYKRGLSPTYDEVSGFLVKSALSMVEMPHIYDWKFFDIDSVYKRTMEEQDYVGEEIVTSIMGMGHDGLEICRRIIRKATLRREEREVLRDVCLAAVEKIT